MDVFAAISRRHSYRGGFDTAAEVPAADLERIVMAGIHAPSGMNLQTTRFAIINAPELVAAIQALHPVNRAMQQARAYIACVVDRDPEPVCRGDHFQVEDCAAAVENMLLAITAMGYATVWVDGWLRVEGRAERIGELLALPAGKIVRVLLPIGVPVESWHQKAKEPFPARAWFNRFDGEDGNP